jgi:hypothetical protein
MSESRSQLNFSSSIGAINEVIIAGNTETGRVDRLQ